MRQAVFTIFFICAGLSARAQHYDQRPGYRPEFGRPIAPNEVQPATPLTPARLQKEYDRLLRCVRVVVEESRGGFQSVADAIRYLDLAQAVRRQTLEDLELVTNACEQRLTQTKPERYLMRSVEWDVALRAPGSAAAKEVVAHLLRPYVNCKRVRSGQNWGLLRTVQGTDDCKGSNGRRELWEVSGAGVIRGFSLGWDSTTGHTSRATFYSKANKQTQVEDYSGDGKNGVKTTTWGYDIPLDEESYSALLARGESEGRGEATLLGPYSSSSISLVGKRKPHPDQPEPSNQHFIDYLLKH